MNNASVHYLNKNFSTNLLTKTYFSIPIKKTFNFIRFHLIKKNINRISKKISYCIRAYPHITYLIIVLILTIIICLYLYKIFKVPVTKDVKKYIDNIKVPAHVLNSAYFDMNESQELKILRAKLEILDRRLEEGQINTTSLSNEEQQLALNASIVLKEEINFAESNFPFRHLSKIILSIFT